jgi:PAS domain S-box-containing protein
MIREQVPPGSERSANRVAEHYHRLLEAATDRALILVDAGCRVVDWGGSAVRLFGYRRDDIVGEPFSRLFFRPEEVQRGEAEFEVRTAGATGEVRGERWFARQDGTALRCRAVMAPFPKSDPEGPVCVVVLRDVTALPADESQTAAAADFDDLVAAVNDCQEYFLTRANRR